MNKKNLMILFALFIFSTNAFAMRPCIMGGKNQNMNMMGNMGSCRLDYKYMAKNFSQEDISKIETERDKFFASTKNLRKSIYIKHHELKNDLAQENPNMEKTWKLREEISSLKTDLDKKRFECIKAMKAINPKADKVFMGKGKRKMSCRCMGCFM